MDANTLRLALNRLLTPNAYPTSPHTFRIAMDQWEAWLTAEKRQVNWREKKVTLPKGANPRGNFARKVLFECDHAGQYRDTRDPNLSPRKRRKTKESIKCGCTASITASWLRDAAGTIEVVYKWQHTGHDPASLTDMRESRNPDEVRKWLDDMVRLGFDGRAIRAMLRMSPEELAQISETAESIPSSVRISGQDVYNALRRRLDAETFLAPEMSESVKLWIQQLTEKDWSTLLEFVPIPGEPSALCIGLVSSWQREMIRKYGDTVCLDSTHNTCVTEDGGKIFLYTLVARDRTTGKGTPLAFMVTDRETHHPLTRFLRWMREATGFIPRSIMIDCSDTEALAISLAFEDALPMILYCYWHLFRAWEKNVKSKIKLGRMSSKEDTAETLRDAMKSLYGLMEAASEAEFDARVDEFRADWADQKAFVLYVQTEWLTCKERWVKAWRAHAHYAIDTNNFIESWHSNLKRNYLKMMRRRRLDFIIRVLTQEVVPDYMRAHVRVGLGFKGAHLCLAERQNRKKADDLLLEDAEGRVNETGDDTILVDSFTQDDISYRVQLTDSAISACSCPYHASTSLPCKHMFLAQRVTTYSIRRDQATLPAAQPALPFDLHAQASEKRAMCSRIAAEIAKISSTSEFGRLAQADATALLPFSRTDLATVLASLEGVRRSAQVLLAGTAPHARQTY